MQSRRVKSIAALLTLVCGLQGAASLQAAETPAAKVAPVYYRLVLEGAMFNPGKPQDVREIVLDLEQIGDGWGTIYAVSRNYNMNFHRGAVKDAKVEGDTISLQIGTEIMPDKWVKGGQGDYTVKVTRQKDGKLAGTFTGIWFGEKVSGKAMGSMYAPTIAKDFKPLEPQEHPRLLFRKHELPAIKAKFETPFGKAARAKLESAGTPAAYAMLYQLTGDKSWAEKAHKEAEEYLAGRKPGGDPFVPKKPLWAQLEQLALTYDLCYDVLPADFKAKYRSWAADMAFQVYFAPETLGTTNWHVVSNHVANVYSGMSLSALALFDEPSAPPAEPAAPFMDDVLPAAQDFNAGDGVPVVTLTPGKSPTEWIHTEPLRRATPDDPRDVFYGLEKIHPQVGTKVKVGDFELTFGKMPAENKSDADIGGLKVGHLIEAAATAKAKEPFTMVLYTVIEVKEPGQFVVINPTSRANLAQLALNGKLLASGQVVKLEKGYYPLMQMVQWRMKWGEIAPMLKPATEADIAAWEKQAAQIKQKYETQKGAYETVLANWKRTGGGDPAFNRLYRLSRFTSALHCEHAVGRGGFQGEVGGYSTDASSGHAQLWPVYTRVMGYELTPNNEYPDFIPRKLIGGPQDINGTTDVPGRFYAALLPTIRKEWQPEILQAWHNEMKVTDEKSITNVLNDDAIRSFLYYPLEMKPTPVGTNLPTKWEAPDFGYYALRSGWGKDAFIAQVFLKSQLISGWNGDSAGTYRLMGLGQVWATGTTDRVRNRQYENVVWLPEGDLNDGGRGKLTHFSNDGKTMVVSVDLNEVYERKGRYWFTKYGNLKFPAQPDKDGEVPPASGVTGMRSIAFDFSGTSGAPCLYVVVDKIDGGSDLKRRWLFQPPLRAGAKPKAGAKSLIAEVVTPAENGFTVAPPGADGTLRGVFAYPEKVEVSTDPLKYSYIKNFGKGQGAKIDVQIDALTVPGKDHFFFVGTVGPGEHPPVKIDGKGLDATVTVGNRTIKFDGQKVVFGTK